MTSARCRRCSKQIVDGDVYCRHCGLRLKSWLASRVFVSIAAAVLLSALVAAGISGWALHEVKHTWRLDIANAQQARTELEANLKQLQSDLEALRSSEQSQRALAETLKKQAQALMDQLNSFGADAKNLEANTAKIRQIDGELTNARSDLAKATRELAHLRDEASTLKGEQITTNNGLYEVKADLKTIRANASNPVSNSRETEAALADAVSRLDRAEKKLAELVEGANRNNKESLGTAAIEPATGGKNVTQNWKSLTDSLSRNERVTQAKVRDILGPPDSIDNYNSFVVWRYKVGSSFGTVKLENGRLHSVNAPNF